MVGFAIFIGIWSLHFGIYLKFDALALWNLFEI